MKGKIWAIYFSPTGNTRKVTCRAASAAALARSHFGQQEADIDPEVTDFYKFTRDSFTMENYQYSDFTGKIPVAL